jgi:predicted RecA/RadA family phage recombinase
MAKNYIQEGKVIPFTASGAKTSGQVVVVGSIVGVAAGDVANGAAGELIVKGVVEIPAATAEITVGAAVYWDADGDPVGGTAGSGAATATATDNTLIGYSIAAKAAAGAKIKVLLK